jgi:phage antirepressor YoqD-like protein
MSVEHEDIAKYLLPKEKLRQNSAGIWQAKRELEKYTAEHELLSKYMERRWFQKSMQQSYNELLFRYLHLAKIIQITEDCIAEWMRENHLHNCAVEELEKSMTPFKNVDMSSITLKQAELFS